MSSTTNVTHPTDRRSALVAGVLLVALGTFLTPLAHSTWALIGVIGILAAGGAVICGTLMSMAAAIYPARVASRMVPADALRSTV